METISQLPLKRMTRPAVPPSGRLTKRDEHIIAAVARFRFLTSAQIVELVGGSTQGILRRLQFLFYTGQLTRPPQQHTQLAAFSDQGNRPLVYGLDAAGAALLAAKDGRIDRRDWQVRNIQASQTFLEHTLATGEAVLAFERACRARGDLDVVDHHQLLALPTFPAATRQLDDPFRLSLSIPRERSHPITAKVAPDRLIALRRKSDDGLLFFAIELDRGTMEIASRSRHGRARYTRKLEAYYHAWRQGRHTTQWGARNSFRVLTITPSETRIAHMIAAQREVTGNDSVPGLFAYSTPQRIKQHGALGPAWTTSKQDGVSLVRT